MGRKEVSRLLGHEIGVDWTFRMSRKYFRAFVAFMLKSGELSKRRIEACCSH